MGEVYDVAVVGADGLVGAAIIEALEAHAFPVGNLHALVQDRATGSVPDYRGVPTRPQDVSAFDFSRVRLAFFSGGETLSAAYARQAADAGCIVIDQSGLFREAEDVPLIVPEVNSHRLSGAEVPRILASPSSDTVALTIALNPLSAIAAIECVTVTALYAVSDEGMSAVESFARQSAAMLGGRGLDDAHWSERRAFNLIPRVGRGLKDGATDREMWLLKESRRVLDDSSLDMNVTAVQAPVFYGHSLAVRIETQNSLSADQALERLSQAPGITLVGGAGETETPTPITHAAGGDTVCIGRVRGDVCHRGAINLWIVADNVRKGAALNSVGIAELLISNHFQ